MINPTSLRTMHCRLYGKKHSKSTLKLKKYSSMLEGMINEEAMQKMNAKVDNEGMMVEQVAEEFLD